MRVSVIVPTYNDLEALKLILEALERQTYKDFEVVIAEDDNSAEVKEYLDAYHPPFEVKHVFQEDKGWRKARALNQAIKIAEGDYLIFFDGDCLPYSTFIKNHVALSEKNRVLCGRRVNLGDKISFALRDREISVGEIESNYFRNYLKLKQDGARHIEQGLDIFSWSFIPKFLFELFHRNTRLVGCNFSVYKSKMVEINGFDEGYPTGDIADDVDIEWRLNAIGVHNKSCKYAADLLHLNHARTDRKLQHDKNYAEMLAKQKLNQLRCVNGIEKL